MAGIESEPAAPAIAVRTEGQGRLAATILASVAVGFLLPVCSCAAFLLVVVAGASSLNVDGSAPAGEGDAVAIVRVEGAIAHSDESDYGPGALSGVVMADLARAAADSDVKAIVLRVDSPGGTVIGSAQIHDVVKGLDKPVVVSMFGVAASGGYYVSAPADYIYARADTITGSIGVIYTVINAAELIDRLGVDVINITTGDNKAIGSPYEELTAEQSDILIALADEAFDDFVQVIVDGRSLDRADVVALADGRIYSGRQALALGLVDALGTLDDAVAKAADLGGIVGDPRLIEYEHTPNLDDFLSGFSLRLQQNDAERLAATIREVTTPALEYRYVGPGAE